jgi:hypothetical protein
MTPPCQKGTELVRCTLFGVSHVSRNTTYRLTFKKASSVRFRRSINVSKAGIKMLLISVKITPENFLLAMTMFADISKLLCKKGRHSFRYRGRRAFRQCARVGIRSSSKVVFDLIGKMSVIISLHLY